MSIQGTLLRRAFTLTTAIAAAILIAAAMARVWLGLTAMLGLWLAFAAFLLPVLMGPAAWLHRNPEAPHPRRAVVMRILTTLFACYLPLAVFVLGGLSVSVRWKGDAPAGWLNLFPATGAIALCPLVLWAVVAMYAVLVLDRARDSRWAPAGLLAGALVAGIMSAVLLGAGSGLRPAGMRAWVTVPVLTFFAYGGLWLFLVRERGERRRHALPVVAATTALASIGAAWAMLVYDRLPDERPEDDCFIVTAASRGHARLVRPVGTIIRKGEAIRVSRQLLAFWEFERVLAADAPRLHSRLRAAYGAIGPRVARHVTSPWRADVVHLALLPAELVARIVAMIRRLPPTRG